MRRPSLATAAAGAAAALLASALPAQPPTPGGVPLAGARGGFVVLVGADTFAVEHVTRTASGFEGELFVRAVRARLAYTASVAPDGRVHRVVAYQWAPGAADSARPLASLQYAFVGDTLVATTSAAGAAARTQRAAVPPGATAWLNPSMGFLDQLTRRARVLGARRGRGGVDVPVVYLTNGALIPVRATPVGADSLDINVGPTQFRLAVGADGALLGGRVPAQGMRIVRVAALDAHAGRGRPTYGAPPGAPYTAEEVRVPMPGGVTLGGTLTRPAGRRDRLPVVLTISGSGPHDRDAAVPVLGAYRPFRDIADTLARRGVAVLRLDDRGVGASGGRFAGSTTRDFAEDVRAAVAWLRVRRDVDPARVALLGHSEGGLVAPLVAATDARIAAVVLMAAPAQPGRRILLHQLSAHVLRDTAMPPARRDSVLARLPRMLDSAAAADPWLRVFTTLDPLPTARRVRAPTLVLHGDTDRQVTPEQADTLAAALRAGGNARVTLRRFPATNHLFVADPVGDPARYLALPSMRVRPEVLGTIADWIVGVMRGG